MKVALYARVSTERQAERGTIGSQLQVLREHAQAGGDELASECVKDGQSGARLRDRPGLDALRDAAKGRLVRAGVVPIPGPARPRLRLPSPRPGRAGPLRGHGALHPSTPTWPPATRKPRCSPGAGRDRRVSKAKITNAAGTASCSAPAPGRSPPGRPPTATAASPAPASSRRTWRSTNPKPRWCGASSPTGPRVSRSARSAGGSTPTASPHRRGRQPRGHCPLSRLLRNEAYIGRVYSNRTETIADPRPARRTRQVPRPREEWIPIGCPAPSPTAIRGSHPRRLRQHQVEPAPRRTRRLATQGPGQMRGLRCRHQLPQDARPKRHLAPLLLLPQPRPTARRRRRAPLPRTQHPRRRAR